MASLNKVLLMGNLTKDPEVRNLPSGIAVCEMRLAATERFKNKEGKDSEQTCFVDIVVWGRQAETCGQYLRKGSSAFVEGRLQLDEWKSKEGENRSKLRVRADRVQFMGSPRGGQARDTDMDQGQGAGDLGDPPPGGATGRSGGGGDDDNLPF